MLRKEWKRNRRQTCLLGKPPSPFISVRPVVNKISVWIRSFSFPLLPSSLDSWNLESRLEDAGSSLSSGSPPVRSGRFLGSTGLSFRLVIPAETGLKCLLRGEVLRVRCLFLLEAKGCMLSRAPRGLSSLRLAARPRLSSTPA